MYKNVKWMSLEEVVQLKEQERKLMAQIFEKQGLGWLVKFSIDMEKFNKTAKSGKN